MGFFSRNKSKAPSSESPRPPGNPRLGPQSLPPPQQQQMPPPPQYASSQPSRVFGRDSSNIPHSNHQPSLTSPPPQGWSAGRGGPSPPPAYYQPPHQQPIIVDQHYHFHQNQTPAQKPLTNKRSLTQLAVDSAVHLTNQVRPYVLPTVSEAGSTSGNGSGSNADGQSHNSMNQLYNRFNDVMTLIDRERYCGDERDLFICRQDNLSDSSTEVSMREQPTSNARKTHSRKQSSHPKVQVTGVASTVISGNYFAKVELYSNSHLPMNLPPLKLYMPTWPLLSLAAQYSERVYDKSRGKERDVEVEEPGRGGKAMVIKSVPMDHMNTIVFAIRGTSSFMDWAVNLNTEPVPPSGFLDDEGNFCHAGFLSVARRMIHPVAAHLRQLVQENPNRRSHSLLITGHSAGGAVAALLYSHMLSTSRAARSELNSLTDCFKRVHCVTFGTPPVTLLPLQKPSTPNRPELKNSLFLSFVNEGDPVARADKAYVRSLLDLFATPVPALAAKTMASMALDQTRNPSSTSLASPSLKSKKSASALVSAKAAKLSGKTTTKSKPEGSGQQKHVGPVWKLPPCTLSNAGRIVVLRSGDPKARLKGKKTAEERLNEGVVAQVATDEQLRTVVWGDPVCHLMKLYAGRLEILATNAVTANGY